MCFMLYQATTYPISEGGKSVWACLHFEAPSRTMLDHPRVEVVIMILHVSKNGLKARRLVRGDVAEQVWGRHAIIEARTGNEDGKQQPPGIDQEMPFRTWSTITFWIA